MDYAGQTMPVVDQATGEIREAQIFVGVLGAGNFVLAVGLPIAARMRKLRAFLGGGDDPQRRS